MARVQTIMTPETLPFAHFFIAEPVSHFFHVLFCRPLMPHGVIGSVCSGLLATQPLSVPRVLQKPFVHVEDESRFLGTIGLQDNHDFRWPESLVGVAVLRLNVRHP